MNAPLSAYVRKKPQKAPKKHYKMSSHIPDGKYNAGGLPPTDSIKLFVGQVPKNMAERDLLPIFKEVGEVYELAVLRDKETNRHRGCAFVTYYNRDDATTAVIQFHDKKKLSPSVGFMQVKPASDCKIFVANLPLDVTADAVSKMFGHFGAVDEVHLIRDQRGEFKGCAFVRYRTKSDAVTAIQRLNEQKQNGTLSNPTANLIVHFADGHRSGAQMMGSMQSSQQVSNDNGNGRGMGTNGRSSANGVLASRGNGGIGYSGSNGQRASVSRSVSDMAAATVTLDDQGLALANWLSNVIGTDARAYAKTFVYCGFRSINDIALLKDEDALRRAGGKLESIVPNLVHRLRIVQASAMVLPPTVTAEQLNSLKRWLEMSVQLERADADRSARRLAASGFIDMADLMMLTNASLCKSASIDLAKILPNAAHRLKIMTTVHQNMLQSAGSASSALGVNPRSGNQGFADLVGSLSVGDNGNSEDRVGNGGGSRHGGAVHQWGTSGLNGGASAWLPNSME